MGQGQEGGTQRVILYLGKVENLDKAKIEKVVLSKEEFSALLEAVVGNKSPYLYPVVMVALTAGLRKG